MHTFLNRMHDIPLSGLISVPQSTVRISFRCIQPLV